MSDIKSFEPLWGIWRTTELIGEGSFGKVYRAERTDFGKTYYAAIKHISIPTNESQKKEALEYGFAGGDADLSKYFDSITENLMQEIALMYEVKGNTNIVSYEDHLTIPKPDRIGYDVFIRMELLTGLNEIIRTRTLPESEVIKLGIDMCSALEVCASKNIIHRDIKPSNIFVGANGEYKLGDFGIARRMENATMGMSKKGTYAYMAPEIYHGQPANLTADIYSLGLVMYRLLNDNRAPFMPIYPAPISAMDHENAILERIISGTPIPPPTHASAALSSVILKATQFDIRQRFATPGEFKRALLQVQKGEELDSTLLLPVTTPQDESTAVLDVSAGIEGTKTAILEDEVTIKPKVKPAATPQSEQTQYTTESNITTTKPKIKRKATSWKTWEIVTAVAILLIGVVSLFSKYFYSCSINDDYIINDYIDNYTSDADITKLDISHEGITNISRLAGLTNLTDLNLDINSISDISPLSELLNLQLLSLGDNNISDISPLSELTNLTILNLYDNNISDISPLSELTNLTILWLSGNNINDISLLSSLTNLTNLGLSNIGISDISPLAGLTNLTYLELFDNNISDISPLAKLTNLTYLTLYDNNISDVSPLAGLTNLTCLDLEGNNISDISTIAGLTNLTYLDLSYNKINSIEPLLNLTNLKELYLVDCGLTSTQKSQLASALPSCDIQYSY